LNPDILKIAATITEDPNVINNIIARWDDKSVLSYATYMKVMAIFRKVLAKHGTRLDEKFFRVKPEASGFTVSNIKIAFDPKVDPKNKKKAAEAAAVPPPGGDLALGAPGAVPGAPPGPPGMPPMGGAPPMPPMEDKQELVDRLIAADGDESVAATFDDNLSVNIYRAVSGEFSKEIRERLGLEVSHFYSASPPASDADQYPIFTVTMPKARTMEVEPQAAAPAEPAAAPTPEAPAPMASPGQMVSPTDLPLDLAPPVYFSDEEPAPPTQEAARPQAESLLSRLNRILG
jgi:hypothetical protein